MPDKNPRKPPPPPPAKKKKWEPPRIKTGQLFESNSLACGKNTPTVDQCTQNPIAS